MLAVRIVIDDLTFNCRVTLSSVSVLILAGYCIPLGPYEYPVEANELCVAKNAYLLKGNELPY